MIDFSRVLGCSGIFAISVLYTLGSVLVEPNVFVWTLGITIGIHKGLTYSTGVTTAITHLPNLKGLVGGFVISGFAVGGFILSMMAQLICNPDDLKPKGETGLEFGPEVAQRFPEMLKSFCGVLFLIIIVRVLTVTKKRQQDTQAV